MLRNFEAKNLLHAISMTIFFYLLFGIDFSFSFFGYMFH